MSLSKEKIELLREKIETLTKMRKEREERKKKNKKLPPGISPAEMVELLEKFDKWCEQN